MTGMVIATAAGVICDVVHVEHEHPYRAIIDTAQNRGCDAIHMALHQLREYRPFWWVARLNVLTYSHILKWNQVDNIPKRRFCRHRPLFEFANDPLP